MGVTLYCLRYGRLPFEKSSIFELYESIRNDVVVCENEEDERFKDLISRLLEKDPAKRISMPELRVSFFFSIGAWIFFSRVYRSIPG